MLGLEKLRACNRINRKLMAASYHSPIFIEKQALGYHVSNVERFKPCLG